MNKYIVHLYPTVRVKLKEPIEAESAKEAAEKATDEFWGRLGDEFNHPNMERHPFIKDMDFSEEVGYALVDVEGDTGYEKSEWVDLQKGETFFRTSPVEEDPKDDPALDAVPPHKGQRY